MKKNSNDRKIWSSKNSTNKYYSSNYDKRNDFDILNIKKKKSYENFSNNKYEKNTEKTNDYEKTENYEKQENFSNKNNFNSKESKKEYKSNIIFNSKSNYSLEKNDYSVKNVFNNKKNDFENLSKKSENEKLKKDSKVFRSKSRAKSPGIKKGYFLIISDLFKNKFISSTEKLIIKKQIIKKNLAFTELFVKYKEDNNINNLFLALKKALA